MFTLINDDVKDDIGDEYDNYYNIKMMTTSRLWMIMISYCNGNDVHDFSADENGVKIIQ